VDASERQILAQSQELTNIQNCSRMVTNKEVLVTRSDYKSLDELMGVRRGLHDLQYPISEIL
jgi:hypothetical protein